MAVDASREIQRPRSETGAAAWLRKNLFGTPFDTILTLVIAAIGIPALISFVVWATRDARWSVVTENLTALMKGLYPTDQLPRLTVAVLIVVGVTGISWGLWAQRFRAAAISIVAFVTVLLITPGIQRGAAETGSLFAYLNTQLLPLLDVLRGPLLTIIVALVGGIAIGRALAAVNAPTAKRALTFVWITIIPIFLVIVRGIAPQTPVLPLVPTNLWGGLLLTVMLAFVASVFSFPLAILLALGRNSGGRASVTKKGLRGWLAKQGNYPVIRLFCIAYVEFFRGVPLLTVLYTGNVLVGFALGSGSEVDSVVRAMVALTLFEASYFAEIIRGGLQALPGGQAEAAKALGLNPVQATVYITLPQALRTVIPALVGQFITLFKDTSLVVIIALLDLLGIAESVRQKAEYSGTQREMYVFVAAIYFVICFAMSIAARRIERTGSGRFAG